MQKNEKIIVAIDGPAGAGKSTIAKKVAEKLNFLYIDTGAIYRALTLKVKQNKLNLEDQKQIIELAKNTQIKLQHDNKRLRVILDGKDVSETIRTPFVTDGVSLVAKIKEVREEMTKLQRDISKSDSCVLEGRDIGTVVFPNAQFKFFLDADFKERTKRRFKELKDNNQDVDVASVEKDMANRDKIDSTREVAPLKQAPDAIFIDTTNLSIDQVVEEVLKWIKI